MENFPMNKIENFNFKLSYGLKKLQGKCEN